MEGIVVGVVVLVVLSAVFGGGTRECPACGGTVSVRARRCPHCGDE